MSEISGVRSSFFNVKNNIFLEDEITVKEPIALFKEWFDQAKDCKEIEDPNAMCLATATKDGIPSARILLCKGFSKDGFKFCTHYTSRKGQELAENPNAAITFFWAPFSRSVRIEGSVEKLPMLEADDYFEKYSYDIQIGALIRSDQSKPVSGRSALDEKEAELRSLYKEGEVPKPPHWGGYILKPVQIEFWQGQKDRIHDRIRFVKKRNVKENDHAHEGENGWCYQRLAP